ncbi:condensation domain-containing protein, partial [Streptomyces sp. AC550_RSS872]|uniref:condensation domain-containing protein n=1 Tax=Streptomyces sp. AC550_RSS872 TaxID=2823689 RepID=UPI001C26FF78
MIRHALTAAQSEVWLAQQLDPNSAHYNIGIRLDFSGPVDPELMAAAISRATADTEALRCRIGLSGSDPHQVVAAADAASPLHQVRLAGHPAESDDWIRRDLAAPVDLLADPLQQHTLLTLADGRHTLYLRYHHILLDGFSLMLYLRRLSEVYSALAAGQECPPCAFGTLDGLVRGEDAYRASEQHRTDRAYWLGTLADYPDPVSLTGRFAPPAPSVLRRTAELTRRQTTALQGAGQRANAPWSFVVIAATAEFMHSMTSQDDILLTLPVTARTGRAALTTPGMLANELPLRLRIRPSMSFAQLVQATAEQVGQAVRHHRFRGEELRRELGASTPEALRGPMVNILGHRAELPFGSVTAKIERPSGNRVRDLDLVFSGTPHSGVRMDFDANPGLYDEDQLDAIQRRFMQLVDAVTADPDRPLGRFDLLTPEERHQLPTLWTGRETEDVPVDVGTRFEEQAAATPDAVALIYAGEDLTYTDLNARANQLGRYLAARGVGPEQFVAVDIPRSLDLIVSLLAVLKTGAAYVPIDPDYPADRIAHILNDAAPALHLTTLDDLELDGYPDGNLTDADRTTPLTPHHPAYMIYTSGSTGRPKGVVVPHSAIDNR